MDSSATIRTSETLEPQRSRVDDLVIPPISELERLRLQNLLLRQQVCREQLNVLTLQFLQTAAPKALQEQIDDLTNQINATAERLFAKAKLDARLHHLDVERGIFVERSKSS